MRLATVAIASLFLSACGVIDGLAPTGVQPSVTDPSTEGKSVIATTAAVPSGTKSILLCRDEVIYTPQAPIQAHTFTDYSINATNQLSTNHQNFSQFAGTTRNLEINKRLPNIASTVTYFDTKGSLTTPFGGGKAKNFVVVIDFAKYRNDPIFPVNANGFIAASPLFFSRIGAGLRITINITTVEANLNFTNLIALAISAETGNTVGTISAEIIGVTSPDITLLAPFTSDLSAESVKRIVESMGSIRAKLHEPDAELVPHYLARIECKS